MFSSSPAKDRAVSDKVTESEDDGAQEPIKKQKLDKHGLPVTKSGYTAIKDLDLVKHISSRRNYAGSLPLMQARLNLGQLFTLFTLVMFGKNIPLERNRDSGKRRMIWDSGVDYCLGPQEKAIFDASDRPMQDAYILSTTKCTQQKIR